MFNDDFCAEKFRARTGIDDDKIKEILQFIKNKFHKEIEEEFFYMKDKYGKTNIHLSKLRYILLSRLLSSQRIYSFISNCYPSFNNPHVK